VKIIIILLRAAGILWVTTLVSICAASTHADGKAAANEKTCSGIIIAVDAKEKAVKLQRFVFFCKTFVLADNCTLALCNKCDASLDDFRPGQKVNVSYSDASGVLVADRIAQEELSFTGRIQALDRHAHTLIVRHWGATKSFTIPDDCDVILDANANGRLDDVQVGKRATVIFEVPGNHLTARQIEQTNLIPAKWDGFRID